MTTAPAPSPDYLRGVGVALAACARQPACTSLSVCLALRSIGVTLRQLEEAGLGSQDVADLRETIEEAGGNQAPALLGSGPMMKPARPHRTFSVTLTADERFELLVTTREAARDWEEDARREPEMAESSLARSKALRAIAAKIEAAK